MAKNMNKTINKVAKAAKRNHGATIAVIAGAGLSVLGNITIGAMTVVKAVKYKKAAVKADKADKAADPAPAAPAPAPQDDEKKDDDNQNPENK
jgi:hypothetical protein